MWSLTSVLAFIHQPQRCTNIFYFSRSVAHIKIVFTLLRL